LLASHSESEDQGLQVSLRHALKEREELKLLIDQIHKRLEKIARSK